MGVMEPFKAEWAFPVVLVPMLDGTLRLLMNHSQLNKVTVQGVYPLLWSDDYIYFHGDAK